MQHVEKFRVFFYRSRDHGRGIMTSYLGSLVHKSLKLTKIMPNSLKLLDCYILSNAPPKKRQQALNVPLFLYRLWLFFVAYSLPLECTINFDHLSLQVCPMHSVLLSAFFDIWEMGFVVSSLSHFVSVCRQRFLVFCIP